MKQLILTFIICVCYLSSSAQLLNGDFEDWYTDTLGHQRLNNWTHLDFGIANTDMFGTWDTSDAEHGGHALSLSRWYSYRSAWVLQMTSIASKPDMLNGFYKYSGNQLMSPYDIDTAVVYVWVTHWNTATSNRDTIGTGKRLLMASAGYQAFTCPISYSDSRPADSLIVLIKPSISVSNAVFCRDGGNCSMLLIDNLSLATTNGISTIAEPDKVSITFSASNKELLIASGNSISEAKVYNLLGQAVYSQMPHSKFVKIPTSSLCSGVNVIVMKDEAGNVSVKKIVIP